MHRFPSCHVLSVDFHQHSLGVEVAWILGFAVELSFAGKLDSTGHHPKP